MAKEAMLMLLDKIPRAIKTHGIAPIAKKHIKEFCWDAAAAKEAFGFPE